MKLSVVLGVAAGFILTGCASGGSESVVESESAAAECCGSGTPADRAAAAAAAAENEKEKERQELLALRAKLPELVYRELRAAEDAAFRDVTGTTLFGLACVRAQKLIAWEVARRSEAGQALRRLRAPTEIVVMEDKDAATGKSDVQLLVGFFDHADQRSFACDGPGEAPRPEHILFTCKGLGGEGTDGPTRAQCGLPEP